MGDFREKQTLTNGQNGSDVSDDEEQMHKRILDGRLKAVPKRVTMLGNGGASTSASSGAGHPDDEMSESLGEDSPKKASLCAGRLWTDTVLMQSLEDKMGGTAGKGTTIAELRDRGAETYALKKVNKTALKNVSKTALKKVGGKRRRSEDIADAMFDDDGSLGGQIDDTKDTKPDVLKEGEDDADEALSVAVDSAVSLWDGVDTGSAEPPIEQSRKRKGKWKRFKRDNRRHLKHKHPWKKPLKQGLKMLQNDVKASEGGEGGKEQQPLKLRKMVPAEIFVPHKLLTPAYDAQKKLFEVDFDAEALSEEQLAQAIADALGETIPELICKAVHFAGKLHAVELFKKCQEVERNGGMLTQNRNRRRTPGGVFMQLFNESAEVSEQQKKEMYKFGAEKQRQSGRFPKWWDIRKQQKEKREAEKGQLNESETPDIIKDRELPRSNELIKPELNVPSGSMEDIPQDG
ncbi:hypothetical protein GPALN_001931 [Globodera pallida]|nr:hypothetical protein GPALN_001931 [Globodera pallida]